MSVHSQNAVALLSTPKPWHDKMMTILLFLCLDQKVFAYAFPEKPLLYDVQVVFEGHVPVSLFQATEQKVKVEWTLSVERKGPQGQDLIALAFSLVEFSLHLWDPEEGKFVKMPFGLESVKEFFPGAEVHITPRGTVKRTTAPRVEFPVRLPGLDSQHIPDVTFLLLEFPEHPVDKDAIWNFTRSIPDAPLECTVTYKGEGEGKESFLLMVKQLYVTLEDENYNIVKENREAKVRVESEMVGTGHIEFSGEKGVVTQAEWQGEAVSRVVPLEDGKSPSIRKLKIKSIIRLHK